MPTQKYLAKYPKRGEIFIADLNPAFGLEIHKKRPVLIISNNILNRESHFVIIAPFSSVLSQFTSFELVNVSAVEGLDEDSAILLQHIRSIDKTRLVKKAGKLSKEKMLEVEEALKLVLGMIELK